MEHRVCAVCERSFPIESFPFRNKVSGRRHHRCRECQSAYCKTHYQANKAKHNKRRQRNMARYRVRNRQFIWEYLSEHPCVDCGESDPLVLQFDHVRGKKIEMLANLMHRGVPIRRLQEEIAKCEVRCVKCHMRKTARDYGWYQSIGV